MYNWSWLLINRLLINRQSRTQKSSIMNAPEMPTFVEMQNRFGAMPISRIRLVPPPGTATEADVVAIHDADRRLFELVDGILVEKTMGSKESEIAVCLSRILLNYVLPRRLGKVLGADGMLRLNAGLIRIPDVSVISIQRYQAVAGIQDQRVWSVVPNLVVEVLSESNSQKEMQDKLVEYFRFGVEEVWYVSPSLKTICVYYSTEESIVIESPAFFNKSRLFLDLVFSLDDVFLDDVCIESQRDG